MGSETWEMSLSTINAYRSHILQTPPSPAPIKPQATQETRSMGREAKCMGLG